MKAASLSLHCSAARCGGRRREPRLVRGITRPLPPLLALEAVASWGLMAAALATSASSLGAGIAVARVGTAAIGALAEKPELFGRVLIFVGLAEGIAIYGLIVSILILNRLG
jgi:V/A-type H+-transporting ATPase subunit K